MIERPNGALSTIATGKVICGIPAMLAAQFNSTRLWRCSIKLVSVEALQGATSCVVGNATTVSRPTWSSRQVARVSMFLRAACASSFVMERAYARSEEHTSELQSLMRISYAVFCLKKNNTQD